MWGHFNWSVSYLVHCDERYGLGCQTRFVCFNSTSKVLWAMWTCESLWASVSLVEMRIKQGNSCQGLKFLQLRGWQRTEADPVSGRMWRVQVYPRLPGGAEGWADLSWEVRLALPVSTSSPRNLDPRVQPTEVRTCAQNTVTGQWQKESSSHIHWQGWIRYSGHTTQCCAAVWKMQ